MTQIEPGTKGLCTGCAHGEVDPGFLRQNWEPGFEVEIQNPVWGMHTDRISTDASETRVS
jgi:hypothetical protein